jgi:hypothetical protein
VWSESEQLSHREGEAAVFRYTTYDTKTVSKQIGQFSLQTQHSALFEQLCLTTKYQHLPIPMISFFVNLAAGREPHVELHQPLPRRPPGLDHAPGAISGRKHQQRVRFDGQWEDLPPENAAGLRRQPQLVGWQHFLANFHPISGVFSLISAAFWPTSAGLHRRCRTIIPAGILPMTQRRSFRTEACLASHALSISHTTSWVRTQN